MVAATRFTGFPIEAFEFYDQLAVNNARPWWQEHKSDYERSVRDPLLALTGELAEEFGPARLFRPYRDTRFSKDKTPIKDHQGAAVYLEEALGYYVQVSASGLFVAGGWYSPQGQQLRRFRDAISSGQAGHLRSLIKKADKQGWEVDGQPVKTKPRGVAADDPNLDLLRMRMLTVGRNYPVEAWLGTRKTLTVVRSGWRQIRPLLEWLADTVGPAVDPADESD